MRAITYEKFGGIDELHLDTRPEPALPPKGLLVSVRASAVNVLDSRTRRGQMGLLVNKKFPKIPGSDLAGVVKAVGASATGFKVGDEVFGATDPMRVGAFAEVAVVDAGAVAKKPPAVSFAAAAALPVTGLAALYSLRELGKVHKGHRVLIHGSSGGAGLMAIQLAKHFGAHVTAVCGTDGVGISRELGADEVLDYRKGPVTFTGKFDAILDYSSRFDFAAGRPYLVPGGRFIEASPTIPVFIGSMIANLFRSQKHLMLQTTAHKADLEYLGGLVEQGKLKVTIAATFPLAEARQAFALQEAGGVIGKVVVEVA